MGCNLCTPLYEPVWCEYYGPIRQVEAENAINAAIADHLHEIGETPAINIRRVVTPHVKVHASLKNPIVSECEDGKIKISFDTTCDGRVTLQAGDFSETHDFPSQLDQSQIFNKPEGTEWIIKFDFNVTDGVSCRMITLNAHTPSDPTVIDDKIVSDGVILTILKVYRQEEGTAADEGFNEGLCLICCTNPSNVVAFPCRHCCMCRECAERFTTMTIHCPVCRTVVTELIECVTNEND